MDGWIDRQMDGWIDGQMDGWLDERMDGWMVGWMVGWMDVIKAVCINVCSCRKGYMCVLSQPGLVLKVLFLGN